MNRDDFLNLLAEANWSNAACAGYAIKTCKALYYSEREISEFIGMLNSMFSNFTIEEAEEEYRNY